MKLSVRQDANAEVTIFSPGPQGPIGMNWRGDFVANTVYSPRDAVYNVSNGHSYYWPGPGTTTATPSTQNGWNILAQRGAVGPQGAQGIQGIQGIQGVQGLKGDKGDQGIQGIQGIQGATGLNWRGAWSSTVDYVEDDTVGYAGASWFASGNPPVGHAPSQSSTYWQLFAAQGAQGVQGIQGPIGNTGPIGPQGIQGIQGVKGDIGLTGRGFNPRGTYAVSTAYAVDDIVQHAFATWRVTTAHTTTTSLNTTNLQLWADRGAQGIQGIQGIQGPIGNTGPSGTIAINTVTTGAAGSSASVTNVGTATAASLNFVIPRGNTGAQGIQGIEGPIGPKGDKGDPGTGNADTTLAQTWSQLQTFNGGISVASPLTILNPGVGNASVLNFAKSSDSAGITVTETESDKTHYAFTMADNPDGTNDAFAWAWRNWQSTGSGWTPLFMNNINTVFNGRTTTFNGNLEVPSGGYVTAPGGQHGGRDYLRTTTPVMTSGSGTINLTVDASSYTGGGGAMWIRLVDATTFEWGMGSNHTSVSVAQTGLSVSTSNVTLSNGVNVRFSAATGGVAGDLWTFRIYPGGNLSVGDSITTTDLTATGTVSAGVLVAMSNTTEMTQGGLRVRPRSASTAGAVIRGMSAQSGHLLQLENDSAAIVAHVTASGHIFEGANRVYSAGNPPPATDLSNYVNRTNAQTIGGQKTFDVIPLVPDNSFTIAKISATGTRSTSTYLRGDGTFATIPAPSTMVTTNTTQTITGPKTFNSSATTVDVTIQAAASQTADLTQWKNSGGSITARIDPAGRAAFGTGIISHNDTSLTSVSTSATSRAAVFRAFADQTQDIVQFQADGGPVLSRVAFDGTIWVGDKQLGAGAGNAADTEILGIMGAM